MKYSSSNRSHIVAFIIEELSVGGAEQMLLAMANEFVELHWEVHVVCLKDAGELASTLNDAAQLHVLGKSPGVDLGLPGRLYRCLRSINPICVNSHLWVANLWTRIALLRSSIPVIATEHSRDTWKPRHYLLIDRLLAFRTAALVAVSEDTASFYRDTVGVSDAKVRVINNGVDTKRYAAGAGGQLRQQWIDASGKEGEHPASSTVLLGTVGRMVRAKNQRRLIDALHLLVEDQALANYLIKLVIVGDGPEREDIEQYVKSLGLEQVVIFAGTRHDIPDVLAAFDVFVLSSDREGHPLTALEAQAAGTPVVLTDAGGSRDAIAVDGDQCGGELVDCNAEALAEALARIIADTDLRRSRAQFAQQYALANFDKSHMVQRYVGLFNEHSNV